MVISLIRVWQLNAPSPLNLVRPNKLIRQAAMCDEFSLEQEINVKFHICIHFTKRNHIDAS